MQSDYNLKNNTNIIFIVKFTLTDEERTHKHTSEIRQKQEGTKLNVIIAADDARTWSKMISHSLRSSAPRARPLKEAHASDKRQMKGKYNELNWTLL